MSTPRTKRKTREEEILNNPAPMDSPAVQALMSDSFVKGSNVEAMEIASALRVLISGQSQILDEQRKQAEDMARMRKRMAEMDQAAEKWEKDRVGFIQEVMDKAASLRSSDPDKVIAKGAIQFTKALEEAKAKNATDMLEFKHRLSTMPKETVVSAGELVTVMEGGRPVNKIFPEVIRLKTFSWTLPPGVPTEVPAVVAEIMRNKRRSEAETRAREEILQKNYEQPVLQQKWAEINKSYNSPTDQ